MKSDSSPTSKYGVVSYKNKIISEYIIHKLKGMNFGGHPLGAVLYDNPIRKNNDSKHFEENSNIFVKIENIPKTHSSPDIKLLCSRYGR